MLQRHRSVDLPPLQALSEASLHGATPACHEHVPAHHAAWQGPGQVEHHRLIQLTVGCRGLLPGLGGLAEAQDLPSGAPQGCAFPSELFGAFSQARLLPHDSGPAGDPQEPSSASHRDGSDEVTAIDPDHEEPCPGRRFGGAGRSSRVRVKSDGAVRPARVAGPVALPQGVQAPAAVQAATDDRCRTIRHCVSGPEVPSPVDQRQSRCPFQHSLMQVSSRPASRQLRPTPSLYSTAVFGVAGAFPLDV